MKNPTQTLKADTEQRIEDILVPLMMGWEPDQPLPPGVHVIAPSITLKRATQKLSALVVEGRIDENESIETILTIESKEPDHCYLHEKYVAQCHACKTKKWRAVICKEYLGVIEDRLTELRASSTLTQKVQEQV